MEKEELLSIVEKLMKERFVLEGKLLDIAQLTQKEKNDLYRSFRENIALLRQVEDELNKMEFQKWLEFIEQCTKEMKKLKKE